MKLLEATLIGLVVGLAGTMPGGLYVLLGSGRGASRQSWLLGFSGGIMIAVVVFDLWPESVHFGGVIPSLFGTAVGVLLVQYFDRLLRMVPWYRKRRFSRFTKVGILLGVGIGVHNFPEGVAMGTTYITAATIGDWLGLALLMAVHNIPEGMAMASAFQIGKVNLIKILLALFMVEIPMAIGSTIGAFLGSISPVMVAVALGFAGGAMFLLVAKELLPMARRLAGALQVSFGFAVGLAAGMLLTRFV
jgi:ZIP family zinc transporter